MKLIALFMMVSLVATGSFCQEGSFSAPLSSFGGNMQTSFNLGDLMGTKVNFAIADDPHIKGNPFYEELFLPSIIVLKNGVAYSGLQTRVNLVTNDIYFKASDSTELVAGRGIIRTVVLLRKTSAGLDSLVFVSGIPPVDHNDGNSYYERLATGKTVFLKYTTKVLSSVQSIAASPLDKQYVDLEAYYLLRPGSTAIAKWRKGKDFIIAFLYDKAEQIGKYIRDNDLKCKSEYDIIKVLQYYNTL